MSHIIPVLFVMIPVMMAIFLYLFHFRLIRYLLFLAQGLLITLFVYYVISLNGTTSPLVVFGGWNELFAISFYNDSLSLIFVGLTLFMWTIILSYTFKKHKNDHVFLFFLIFLEGIFLGLIQTNDLFNLFVFLELTTVIVTILIAYNKSGTSFKAAIYYLLLNTVGAMFFLLGIIMIYYVYGTINIQYLIEHVHRHSSENLIKMAYVFMLSGISIKAAFFPLFTWLPRAHGVAQTAVSALLSGLIVKGALYMFIRIHGYMFGSALYPTQELFFYIGVITGIIGVMFALVQKDLKQILAYHTVSQIGIMMMGLSSMADLSFMGGLMHVLNHALFKSLLFLGAGQVIYVYKTKKVYDIEGVLKTIPLTGIVLIVGMLSITGAPLFNGYVSKSLIKYDFKYDTLKMILFTIINIGTVTSFIKFSRILFGPRQKTLIKKPDVLANVSMVILALACLGLGILYQPFLELIWQNDANYVKLFDLRSWLDYILYLGLGYLLYRYIIKKDSKPLKSIRNFQLSFEDANYMLILYISIFFGLMFYVL